MSDINKNTIFDLTIGALHDVKKSHELGELVKEQLIKDGGVTSTFQAFRCCDDGVFDIMETVVDALVSGCCFDNDYFNEFAELHNHSEFSCNDESVLYTSVFCGNYWDTNNQYIDAGSKFCLPVEWFFTRPYTNVDKFVLGHMTFDEVLSSIRNDICKSVNDRVSMCLQKASERLQADMDGCTADDFKKFIMAFKDSAGCDFVDIASTKDGVDKLIIKGQTKPIKINVCGDTRTVDITTSNENGEGGIDMLVQTKLGVGVVVPNVFANFKLLQ